MYVYTVDSKVRIQTRQTPEMYKKVRHDNNIYNIHYVGYWYVQKFIQMLTIIFTLAV